MLEDRLSKDRIVAVAFLFGGVCLVGAAFVISGPVILLVAGVLGLTFAWKKVSVDTLVQESLPDGFRGRVFSVYDFFYNVARIVAAVISSRDRIASVRSDCRRLLRPVGVSDMPAILAPARADPAGAARGARAALRPISPTRQVTGD